MVSRRAREQKTIAAMLAPRLAGATAALVFCVSLAADAEEPPAKAEAPQTTAEAKPNTEATPEFKPPLGFRTKKRGDTLVYCRKESPLGSRFPAEKCYDEAGKRELRSRPNWSETIRACGKGACTTN